MIKFSGVLLYFISKNNDVYFILGEELNGFWNLFGGGPESTDLLFEAARECEEETMGFFGSKEQIAARLPSSTFYQTPSSIIYFLRLFLNNVEDAQMIVDSFRSARASLNGCSGCSERLEMKALRIFRPGYLSEHRYILRPAFRENLDEILNQFNRERALHTQFI